MKCSVNNIKGIEQGLGIVVPKQLQGSKEAYFLDFPIERVILIKYYSNTPLRSKIASTVCFYTPARPSLCFYTGIVCQIFTFCKFTMTLTILSAVVRQVIDFLNGHEVIFPAPIETLVDLIKLAMKIDLNTLKTSAASLLYFPFSAKKIKGFNQGNIGDLC